MDVGAYSSQNLISPYLTGAQSRPRAAEDQNGLRPGQKDAARGAKGPKEVGRPKADDKQVKLPSEAVKQADQAQRTGAADRTRVDSAKPANEPENAETKATEEQHVRELQTTDREVRSHEAAHKAAAGQHGGPVSFDYEKGPDGRLYAVGGEVSIDISNEGTPEATIAKMRQVRAAAMAPASPSAQDRAVAAAASSKSMQAARELRSEKSEGTTHGLQSTGKNSRIGAYQKNESIIDAPALIGKQGEATGFQDVGTIKTGAKKGISTFA